MSMLLVPRSTILVSEPVRRSRWKRSDRSWTWRKTWPASRRAASCPTFSNKALRRLSDSTPANRAVGVGGDQPGDDAERDGVARHAVDHRLVGEGHRRSTAALPASTSTTAAMTRALSSASPFGHSIGRKRHSAPKPAIRLVC